MTKSDVISEVSNRTGIETDTTRVVVESFFDVVKAGVSEGETIYIRTFGSFEPKKRAKKTARNIKLNTALVIDAHHVPAFKPSADFKSQVRALAVPVE